MSAIISPATTAQRDSRRTRRARSWALMAAGVVGLLVFALAAFVAIRMMQPPPADLDTSRTRTTAQGIYQATIEPGLEPIPLNRLHSWTLTVRTPDGQPVEVAEITVDGGMPQHGHGLPTQPAVTRYLGEGRYLVEGMKFQMPGWWVVDFTITAGEKADSVRFNLVLD